MNEPYLPQNQSNMN